jgi:hypothetical protein
MWTWLGWLAIIAAAALGYYYLQQREQSGPAKRPEEVAQRRRPLMGAIVAALAGVLLLVVGSQARPALKQTYATDFSTNPEWLAAGGDNAKWDEQGQRFYTKLEVGSGRYGAVPVDWNGGAFRAEWDITITALPAKSTIAVGLCDPSLANIDDTDHVGGSTIQATFNPEDVYLRTADTNLVERSDSLGLQMKPKLKVETGKTYHCVLLYEDVTDTAALQVSEQGATTPLVSLKVEDLGDFSPNASYFAVTVRGYNRFKAEKPTAECTIDNVRFFQP